MHIKGKKKVLQNENPGNFISIKKISKEKSLLNLSPIISKWADDYNNYGDAHFVPSFKNKSIGKAQKK